MELIYKKIWVWRFSRLCRLRGLRLLCLLTPGQLMRIARTFAAVLQLFCPAALLPGLLRCLCRFLLPFWACTAFVDLLPGLLRCLCRLLLPFLAWATLSTFTAFVDFYSLYQILLPLSACTAFAWFFCRCPLLLFLSTFTAFVGLHCLCLIFLSLSSITAFINFYCLCQLALPVSDFAVVVGYADFAYWMSQLAYLIHYFALELACGFLQSLSLYRDRSHLVNIYIYT